MMTNNRKIRLINGLIFANIFGIAIVGITKIFVNYSLEHTVSNVLIFSDFVIVPALMGIISMWFWKDLDLQGQSVSWYSCLNGLISILFSFLFLGEGAICLIIVSPILMSFVIAGAFLGRAMFKKKDKTLNVSILSILIAIFIGDSLSKHEYVNEVSDQIVINARPTKIWDNVVAFKRIEQPNIYWLFRAGMPSPVESTVEGHYKGAARKCIFSNGYIFDEKISVYEPNHNLTFDIVNQPRDPEIMGHIDIMKGQFILKDNGNGTTTLIGNSWYKLYVFPVWYYDLWAESITRNVHLRVMQHIKELSEHP
jgi:hypothetical protein